MPIHGYSGFIGTCSETPPGPAAANQMSHSSSTSTFTSRLLDSLTSLSFNAILTISTLLRISLILYSEWHDAHSVVKYTDVDYRVFSDAAALVAAGASPYQRATYRYSPLLAWALTPNTLWSPAWGKVSQGWSKARAPCSTTARVHQITSSDHQQIILTPPSFFTLSPVFVAHLAVPHLLHVQL